jgi:ribbon-helix-helix CopG family protein
MPVCYTNTESMMYTPRVKRLQIMIDEDLDDELERLAAEEDVSKAALIRRYVRERIRPLPPLSADPLATMVGADDFEPEPVDDVVYG